MSGILEEVQRLGQAVWYDNIRRGLIVSGELQQLIDLGVTGVTSNPTIFEKAVAGSTDYDSALTALAKTQKSPYEIFEALAVEDIQATADLLRPVYELTGGVDGYVSLEVSPTLAHDTEGTVAEAGRLFRTLARPSVMVKVPATPEGIPAIRRLIGEGINVNITLIFSRAVYSQVMDSYLAGLEDLARSGGNLGSVASVASFFVSRIDTSVDAILEGCVRQGDKELAALLGQVAIANARLAYQQFISTFTSPRFDALRAGGARVQRPLWASTGTKNPAYSDMLYVESLVGPDTVNTVPPSTLSAFLDHGRVAPTLEQDLDKAGEALESLARSGIDIDQVTTRLLDEGVRSFAESWQKLLANVEEKVKRLEQREHTHSDVTLDAHLSAVEGTAATLEENGVTTRIWQGDHTVWKPTRDEITDRLGWLSVTDVMCEQVPALQTFVDEIRQEGIRHVVLLGMGGSSLGPEVLRQSLGSSPGYPELIVLDSTVPAWVQAVTDAIDLASTLFLVSSKSGTTLEPLSFYKHFRALMEERVGKERAGGHFVAVTDPGTPLERLASEHGFRRTFLNPSNIGGRYSILSYFGLVPAGLMGVDLAVLLDRADCMREGCASCVPAHDNPGAWLGAIMGTLALEGRDKLTLAASPAIASFGLWVEQLVAESTGKEGKGIIPFAGEPLLSPDAYGNDRLFVYLRLEGDDNAILDGMIERLKAAGHPVVRLELRDSYDMGAEFFRWEFAIAVAGAVLGINPFNQPNVQEAKDRSDQVLQTYQSSGQLPDAKAPADVDALLEQTGPGDYLAIMAYLYPTPEVEAALTDLRGQAMERHQLATTLGYGPRFLHSTGQLHKGGPDNGLFLQLVDSRSGDLPIPGESYTFGVLADAQANGDIQALQARGRRVARVRLGPDAAADIRGLLGRVP